MTEEDLFSLLGKEPSSESSDASSKKPKPLPKPRAKKATKPKVDRLLTEGERKQYRRFSGVWPLDSMRLSEFRKFMGGYRRGGGFK